MTMNWMGEKNDGSAVVFQVYDEGSTYLVGCGGCTVIDGEVSGEPDLARQVIDRLYTYDVSSASPEQTVITFIAYRPAHPLIQQGR
jgi:hypothetical protein